MGSSRPAQASVPCPAVPERFPGRMFAVATAALLIRLAFAATAGFDAAGSLNDSFNYHLLGEGPAAGRGYHRAFDYSISGVLVPTAEFPPLFPLLLAGLSLVGIDTISGQELALSFVGAGTVVLVGLLGREVAGPSIGLMAAAIAAVHP